MTHFELAGALRRIRRAADLSQRELAESCGVGQSVVARAETGRRTVSVEFLSRAATLAGLRLALLDADGLEVPPMAAGSVRDAVGRHYPAHLDTRYGDQWWWHGEHRFAREQPWYTFDRSRFWRDEDRQRLGTPPDHQLPRPGDAPAERAAAWRRAREAAVEARSRRAQAAREQRRAERVARGLPPDPPDPFEPLPCTCPPTCDDELDRHDRHALDCPCRCDID